MDNANISHIQFGLLSSEEILNLSVCEVNNSKLSGPNSVYDDRMGVILNNKICYECLRDNKNCSGHFGHINMNINIMHPLFYKKILAFLKCFCFKCSSCILTEDLLKLRSLNKSSVKLRFKKIIERSLKIGICRQCFTIQPSYIFNTTDNIIYMIYKNKKDIVKTQLLDKEIRNIFENISDKDIQILGFNPKIIHPKNLIISVLPVLPPVSRPFIIAGNLTCDDDITIQYLEIIKANNHLLDNNLTETKRQKYIHTLKFRIKCLFDNSQDKARHTNGRPMKCIKKRLCGKEGQIRSNLMGKRVDKSARTVIGPGPHLNLDEIGIPKKFASILTYPVKTTKYNYDYLTKLISNHKANYIIKNNNTRINLEYAIFKKPLHLFDGDEIYRDDKIIKVNKYNYPILLSTDKIKRHGTWIENTLALPQKKYNLEIGDIVERHLQNGDIVLLNRQPTLHKGSMLAQKVRINNSKTIQMNLAITKTFNADFDGDEMNLHIPSDPDTENELRMISSTSRNIISAQASKPSICIVQDSLLAVYLMTKSQKKISKDRFFQIAMKINYNLDIIKKIKYIKRILKICKKNTSPFTGSGLISLLLPTSLIYNKKNNISTQEPFVKIYRGVIIEGVFNKSIVGSSHNSLIQILNKEYGFQIAVRFINNIQFIANEWLLHHGFSVSMKDCIATKDSEIRNVVTRCFVEAKGVEETTQNHQIREIKVNAALSKARDHGMKIAKDALGVNNNFISTVTSGSKGDYFNIAQITGLLGQQNLTGARIPPVLNQNTRTLPHYDFKIKEKDVEYESKGFIKHSFSRGLNPREFWFHAVTGREGVTDTAMKTATSGYTQRRMVKCSEDVKIEYDGTVRNSANSIIQFNYGEDNLDGTKAVLVNNISQACDISRLVDKLNLNYEISKKK